MTTSLHRTSCSLALAGALHLSEIYRASLVLSLSLLASCGQQSEENSPTTSEQTTAPAASSPAESPAPESPPEKPFFAGHWAADEANCQTASWNITERGLETPGEVACDFHRITPTQRGMEVEATCTAEGPPQEWKLQFSYAESARALLIENAPFADIGLIRCNEDSESAAKGARGASDVLSKYYELLSAKRFDDASQLWTAGDREQTPEQSVADYQSYEAHVGEPGRIEGAAGSLYIGIPVQIDAKRKSGESVHLSGEATLRRVNDVPGATPEQLSWHIYRIELQPAAGG